MSANRETQTAVTGTTRLGDRGWRGRQVKLLRHKTTRGGAVFAYDEVLRVVKALNGRLDLCDEHSPHGARRINGVPMWQVALLPRISE